MRKRNLNKDYSKSANNNRFEKVSILISCSDELKIVLFGSARLAAGVLETLLLTTERASFSVIQFSENRLFIESIPLS